MLELNGLYKVFNAGTVNESGPLTAWTSPWKRETLSR